MKLTKSFDFVWPKEDVQSPQIVEISIRGRDPMTPQQQAAEYAEAQIVDVHDSIIQMERQDWIDNTADDWLAGHAAGIQAERERIWAEIGTESVSGNLRRIIFGETL